MFSQSICLSKIWNYCLTSQGYLTALQFFFLDVYGIHPLLDFTALYSGNDSNVSVREGLAPAGTIQIIWKSTSMKCVALFKIYDWLV